MSVAILLPVPCKSVSVDVKKSPGVLQRIESSLRVNQNELKPSLFFPLQGRSTDDSHIFAHRGAVSFSILLCPLQLTLSLLSPLVLIHLPRLHSILQELNKEGKEQTARLLKRQENPARPELKARANGQSG